MDETLREQIALFRFGVISELVSRPLAPGEKEQLLQSITEREWTVPGKGPTRIGRSTARDWVSLYQAMGLDGLKPRPRSDRGASRAIPEAAQDLLLALRQERPKASTESLIRAARLSGRVDADVRLAPSTVHRLFAAHGLPCEPPLSPAQPDALAFTHPHAGDLWMSDVERHEALLDRAEMKGLRLLPVAAGG